MVAIFQVLFSAFAIFAISNIIHRKKDGLLSVSGLLFWLVFWVVAAIAVLWPNTTQMIADRIGIGRGTDLVVYAAVAIMFFLLFKLHIKIEKINRDVTKVVRWKALEGVEKNIVKKG